MLGMGKLKRFGRYWRENFSPVKEAAEMVTAIVLGIFGFIGIYLQYIGYPLPDWLESRVMWWVEWVAFLSGGLYLVIYRPFVRHEELQAEIDRLNAPPSDFAIEFDNRIILPPEVDDGNNSECSFVVRNNSGRTIGNIELEIADLFEKGDPKRHASGLGFPIALSTFSDDEPSINSGKGLNFKFLWQAGIVTVGENRFVRGHIANDGSQVSFKVGEEYPITLLVRGQDTKQHAFTRKLVFLGDYPAPSFK